MHPRPDEQTQQLPTSDATRPRPQAVQLAESVPSAPRPDRPSPWLRAWTQPRFWLRIFLVLAGIPLAVLGLLVLPLLVISLVLAPFGVLGSPLLWLTVVAARRYGHLSRSWLRRVVGVRIHPSTYPGFWRIDRYSLGWLRAPDRWREIAYAVLRFPTSLCCLALAAMPWMAVGLAIGALATMSASPGGWLLLGSGAAFMLAPLSVWASRHVDVWLAQRLLGPDERAELNQRVSALIETRAGVVAAADAERQRIERDLHDGAQQSLVTLALHLGMARARFDSDPQQARQLVEQSHEEAKAALVELRNLVRGMHPAVLDELGLDAALSALAARCPVPVDVDVAIGIRPPRAVESAAYFVVAETLTNIGRHSQARKAELRVSADHERVRLQIRDDGVGGADPTAGTGLAGLAGRVRALDGDLTVESPAGGPTIVRVEMPCGS